MEAAAGIPLQAPRPVSRLPVDRHQEDLVCMVADHRTDGTNNC